MIAANSPAGKAGKPLPAVCATCGGSPETTGIKLFTWCSGCGEPLHDARSCSRFWTDGTCGHPLCERCSTVFQADCGHTVPVGVAHIDNADASQCPACYRTWLDAQLSPFASCPAADDARWSALLTEWDANPDPERQAAALDRIARAVEALAPVYGPGSGPSVRELLRRERGQ